MESSMIPGVSSIEAFYEQRSQQLSKYKPERQRDVLFGAGCGLLCFGLFPFSASATISSETSTNDSATPTAFQVDEFDSITQWLSLAFSLVGLVCVTLSCVVVSRSKLRVLLALVLVPLATSVCVSCSLIVRNSTVDDVVNILRGVRVITFDQDMRLERSVNDVFCVAHVRELCENGGDVVRSEKEFGIYTVHEMETACSQVSGDVSMWMDYDPKSLIAKPSRESMLWCGQYVSGTHDFALNISQSPYQQHRPEVLDRLLRTLAWRQARVKLLMVLEWFATPALLAVLWWLKSHSPKVQT